MTKSVVLDESSNSLPREGGRIIGSFVIDDSWRGVLVVKVVTDSCSNITPDDLQASAGRLKNILPLERFYRSRVSPVVGTQIGPYVLAVAVSEAE
jgi:hypothetical protein